MHPSFYIFIGILITVFFFSIFVVEGKKVKWASDPENLLKLIYYFAVEGMMVAPDYKQWRLIVHVFHKGTFHKVPIPTSTAYRMYKKDPSGKGLKNQIIKKYKLGTK